ARGGGPFLEPFERGAKMHVGIDQRSASVAGRLRNGHGSEVADVPQTLPEIPERTGEGWKLPVRCRVDAFVRDAIEALGGQHGEIGWEVPAATFEDAGPEPCFRETTGGHCPPESRTDEERSRRGA